LWLRDHTGSQRQTATGADDPAWNRTWEEAGEGYGRFRLFRAAAVTDPRGTAWNAGAPDRQKQEATTEGAGKVIQEPAKLAEAPPSAKVSADSAPAQASAEDAMRQKLRSPEGRAVYKMRKAVVEPVFGQIKECRGFRRFLFRGLKKVEAEWQIICLTHNLLKLFRAGVCPQEA
jgi:hypothetical protein